MQATFPIRLAEPDDLKKTAWQPDKSGALQPKKILDFGKTYFVKSLLTGNIEGPYRLSDTTNIKEFSAWFKDKRIYVIQNIEDK